MTKDEVKAELSEYGQIKGEREELRELLREAEGWLRDNYSITLTGMPRGKAGPKQAVERNVAQIEALQRLYAEADRRLMDKQIEIEGRIRSLPTRERRVLRMHYVQGVTFEKIGEKLYFSERHVYNIHDKALKLLAERDG